MVRESVMTIDVITSAVDEEWYSPDYSKNSFKTFQSQYLGPAHARIWVRLSISKGL